MCSSDLDPSRGLGLGFFMCIIVLMVNNMFGDRWTYTEVSAYLWVFAALVVRLNILSGAGVRTETVSVKKLGKGMVQGLNDKYKTEN